jgi:GTP-binding protein
VGTLVRDNVEDITLCELLVDGEERIVVEGGKPGLGNMHFKTATNRAPRETTPGGLGVHRRVGLELKLVADVGLLGFPNAGKSTLISVISAARPKIADYPFTTLVPNLGVVAADDVGGSFVVADIPGLIEGAAEGRGLGLQFLRHVERTRMLLHLVALDEEEPTPVRRWQILRDELRRYDTDLLDRPEIVVLTKSDVVDAKALTAVRKAFAKAGVPEVHVISAATRQGVSALIESVWTQLRAHSASPPAGV